MSRVSKYKFIALIIATLLMAISFSVFMRKETFSIEDVERKMENVRTQSDLHDMFGDPDFISKSIDGSYIEYTYFEADEKKIKDEFVGFDVRFSGVEEKISWKPIYLNELSQYMK